MYLPPLPMRATAGHGDHVGRLREVISTSLLMPDRTASPGSASVTVTGNVTTLLPSPSSWATPR